MQKGLVRSIGMSNFSRRKLEGLLAGGVAIKPAVLQVCLFWCGPHPGGHGFRAHGGGPGAQHWHALGLPWRAWCVRALCAALA